jgi:hypothetical protein
MDNSDQIKKIAKDVYRVLGSGFSEDVYDRAMQGAGGVVPFSRA